MGAGVVVSTVTVVVSAGATVVSSGIAVVVSSGVIISYEESGVVCSSTVFALRQDARQSMQLSDSESATKEVIFFIFCSPFCRPGRHNFLMIYSVKQCRRLRGALFVKEVRI